MRLPSAIPNKAPRMIRRTARSFLIALMSLSCATGTAQHADFESVFLAVRDLRQTFGADYLMDDAGETALREAADEAAASQNGDTWKRWDELARAALLANPLLNFDSLIVVKRSEKQLGLSQNWESNSTLPMSGFDNEIAILSPLNDGALTTLYRPEKDVFVGDVDLHFDADRLLFSMPGDNGRWQIHELNISDKSVRQLPLITEADVDNYDACYLPDGNILFTSTAPFVGVPCVTGSSHVSNIYRHDTASGRSRPNGHLDMSLFSPYNAR